MRRPFLWPSISLAIGILFGRFFPLPHPFLFLVPVFLLPFLWFLRGRRFFLPLFLAAIAIIGMLRIRQVLTLPSQHIYHFAQKGTWVSLEGKVDSLPLLKEKGRRRIYSFVLESANLIYEKEFFETTGKVQVFLFNPSQTLVYGSRVRMRGRLDLPKSSQNPGEFDYREYLVRQGIHALFEGYGSRSLKVLDHGSGGSNLPQDLFLTLIQKIRESTARRLDRLFRPPVHSLLKALLLGIRQDLPEEFRDDFIKTGTTHLVAISGINITLVAGSFFLAALWVGLPQKGAALTGFVASTFYVFLSGAGIPVIRAGWMSGLFFVGLLLEREKDFLNGLFFAFFMILAFDPASLFQVGFQLSFLSVLSLVLLNSSWLQTVSVLIGTFPICIAYFNIFSWTSIFANLLAIPLFHLGVLGGWGMLAVAEVPLLGPLGVRLTSMALKAGIGWIHFWAARRWGYVYLAPPSWKLIVFYYLALSLAFVIHRFPKTRFPFSRPLSLSLWLVGAVCFFIPRPSGSFVLTVLAAGQNEVFHVEFPGGKHWLVNAGRARPSNQARWILAPFLKRLGINQLAGIFLTDFSHRHGGGLAALEENFSLNSLLFSGGARLPAELDLLLRSKRMKRLRGKSLHSGDRIPIEKGEFQILKVVKDYVFLTVRYENQTFLFLPTWKAAILEEALPELKKLSSLSPINALLLPAAGYPSDSHAKEILSILLPQCVVIARDKPALEPFLQSLKEEEIPVFFLAQTGALRFEMKGGRLLVTPFRLRSPGN